MAGFLNEVQIAPGKILYTAAYQDEDGKPTTRVEIGRTNFVMPVDVQGLQVGEGEQMPVKITDNAIVTEYQKGVTLAGNGANKLFNHEVKGRALGIAVRLSAPTDFKLEQAYVVPGTENTILLNYADVINGTAVDNKGARVDSMSKYARFRLTNNGTSSVTITSVTIVDFL